MTIAINGMAHVILTVSRFDVARAFYAKLLPALGMTIVNDTERLFYGVGSRTAIGIQPCDPAYAGERFVQTRIGLHHLCLRARSRDDVDQVAALLTDMNATIVRGPLEGSWAPGTTTCCSRIRTASGSRSTSCRARACSRPAPRSTRPTVTPEDLRAVPRRFEPQPSAHVWPSDYRR